MNCDKTMALLRRKVSNVRSVRLNLREGSQPIRSHYKHLHGIQLDEENRDVCKRHTDRCSGAQSQSSRPRKRAKASMSLEFNNPPTPGDDEIPGQTENWDMGFDRPEESENVEVLPNPLKYILKTSSGVVF